MAAGTHIRIGGTRIELRSGGTLRDAAEGIEWLGRTNLRALQRDPKLREEAIRRVMSPSCAERCYVRTGRDGAIHHDCHCPSGFQYSSDEHAQALESCPARDVWSDLASLIAGHHAAGRGDEDPIVCDCDDLTPAAISVAAWIAWFSPQKFGIAGVDIGAYHDDDARYAIAITRPPGAPIAHAYGLTNREPPSPQPRIVLRTKADPSRPAAEWFVWDPAAHWGMNRPKNSFYADGEIVAYELRRDNL